MERRIIILLVLFLLLADFLPVNAQRRRLFNRDSRSQQEEVKQDTSRQQRESLQRPTEEAKPDDNREIQISERPSRESPDRTTITQDQIEMIIRENDRIIETANPVVTEQPNGRVNWTEQYIEAKGESVIDSDRFPNPAQAKAMATRGAVVVAQRNLLEIINGVQVNSETVVVDMITTSDVIYTRVDGVIKGAEIVGEPVESMGMMEVTMRVPLYGRRGLAGAIYDGIPEVSGRDAAAVAPVFSEQEISEQLKEELLGSLVFDFKGQKIDPSMFPVILDENNNLLLDLSQIYDPNQGNFPKYIDASKDLLETLGYKDGVKILDVLGTEPGVIKIDSGKARSVNWSRIGEVAGAVGRFLMLFI